MSRCPGCRGEVRLENLVPHLIECLEIQPGVNQVFVLVVNVAQSDVGQRRLRLTDHISFDRDRLSLDVAGTTHQLSPLEGRLLAYLIGNPGHVLSREHILNAVWGYDAFDRDRAVDDHISDLRKLLRQHPSGSELIGTVRNGGYRWNG